MFLDFCDFIKTCNEYANDNSEWVDLFYDEIIEDKNEEDNYFVMAAMTENNPETIEKCLQTFDWGYKSDSFGKSTFYKYSGDEEIKFSPGDTYHNFDEKYEYLVTFRSFSGNYKNEIDINPMLKWYGNLAETEEGFVDTITGQFKVKKTKNRISILREYLKDFLAAYNKVCIIGYDNRRYINTEEKIENKYIEEKNNLFNYSLIIEKDKFAGYSYYSCILGKVIIKPYKEPLHPDYEYFKPKEEEFMEYIIAVDKETGKEITYTCDENKLSNYFGANPGAPNFITPVYFTKDVLDRYTNNPSQYTVADDHIMFLNIWSIPYTINKEDKVIVWLGDLGRIPYKEQQYWKVFNISPYGKVNEKFIKRQLMAEWTESIGEEKQLFSLIDKLNNITKKVFGEGMFKDLPEGDKQLESAFIIPSNKSITQYQTFLIQLNKLTVERINTKLISKMVDKEDLINPQDGKKYRSRIQLSIFLKNIGVSNEIECDKILKLIADCRNKIAGHSASIPQYNKLWNRPEDENVNYINDAKVLLETLNKELRTLLEELDNGKE